MPDLSHLPEVFVSDVSMVAAVSRLAPLHS